MAIGRISQLIIIIKVNKYPTNELFGSFKNSVLDAVRTRSTETCHQPLLMF